MGPHEEPQRERQQELVHPVWSATSCDYPGAGLYIGLAPRLEHVVVERLLTPKRVRAISGASTRFGNTGSICRLEYYSVRDPSLVRVIPVNRPPLPNGFRHVKLSFQMQSVPRLSEGIEEIRRDIPTPELDSTCAFILTIGLPLAEEDAFYQRAVAVDPHQDFTDVYSRLRDMCKPSP